MSDTASPLPQHPLNLIGVLDARYYCVRLTGVIPLRPDTLPAVGETTLATFRLQSERKHPHSRTDRTLHLPRHARNTFVLNAVTAAIDAASAALTNRPITTPEPRQHDASAPAGLNACRINPTMPYGMPLDSIEFFPLSSLHLPHDIPPNQPVNLTDWFVADTLAAAHTYTMLMDGDTRARFNNQWRANDYETSRFPAYYPGTEGYSCLMEGVFFPSAYYTHPLTMADIIKRDDSMTTPLPPHNTWFKLTATMLTPTAETVGDIGAIRPAASSMDWERPYTHYAAWMDCTLSRPAHPGIDNTRRFDTPYFSTSSYTGLLYQYPRQTVDLNDTYLTHAANEPLPSGHHIAHSLPLTTGTNLMHEAREYAQLIHQQRASTLAHLTTQAVATVAYSDLLCFTKAGRLDLSRTSLLMPVLTRVNVPTKDDAAHPLECVATEQQYVKLHQLMSTHIRDARMHGVASAAVRDTYDVLNNEHKLDESSRDKKRALISATTSPRAHAAMLTPHTQDIRRRGRPKGARVVMTYDRFVKAVKEMGLMADNALRQPSQHTRVVPRDFRDPTDNWTRLTPLMPPAGTDPLTQAKYGRALPVRAINNQRIDSLLWRSLLDAWINHPTMRDAEEKRPPLMQITRLRHDITDAAALPRDPAKPVPYTSSTEMAYATIYIPISAVVMHKWLTEGPTDKDLNNILPKTHDVPGGRYGRYLDPRIDPETHQHTPLKFYPEAMLAKGQESTPTNEVESIKCLPQARRDTSWHNTTEQIPWMVDLAPMAPMPPLPDA